MMISHVWVDLRVQMRLLHPDEDTMRGLDN
jgi:hypothetical protein